METISNTFIQFKMHQSSLSWNSLILPIFIRWRLVELAWFSYHLFSSELEASLIPVYNFKHIVRVHIFVTDEGKIVDRVHVFWDTWYLWIHWLVHFVVEGIAAEWTDPLAIFVGVAGWASWRTAGALWAVVIGVIKVELSHDLLLEFVRDLITFLELLRWSFLLTRWATAFTTCRARPRFLTWAAFLFTLLFRRSGDLIDIYIVSKYLLFTRWWDNSTFWESSWCWKCLHIY